MTNSMAKLKQASLLWLEGLREACCLHRVVKRAYDPNRPVFSLKWLYIFRKTSLTCSIFILKSVIIPTLQWILPDHCPEIHSQESCAFGHTLRFYSFLRLGLEQLFYVFWFYPMYIFSFILSTLWYNDIAKYGFFVNVKYGHAGAESSSGQMESPTTQDRSHADKPTDLEGIVIGMAEQAYSVLLLSFFFLEVFVTGFIPYIGTATNFLLLSWMYAYYCFEYKWNLSGLSLDKKLDFFESNWAFFAGFGCPCILATFIFSPLVSYGVMAILYPLMHNLVISTLLVATPRAFVLTATGSEADKVIAFPRRKWKGAGLGRVPIFYAADYLSMRVLSLFPMKSHQQ